MSRERGTPDPPAKDTVFYRLFCRRAVRAEDRGVAAFEVSHAIGNIEAVVRATAVYIAAVMPCVAIVERTIGAQRFVAAFEEGHSVGYIQTVIAIAVVYIPDNVIASGVGI